MRSQQWESNQAYNCSRDGGVEGRQKLRRGRNFELAWRRLEIHDAPVQIEVGIMVKTPLRKRACTKKRTFESCLWTCHWTQWHEYLERQQDMWMKCTLSKSTSCSTRDQSMGMAAIYPSRQTQDTFSSHKRICRQTSIQMIHGSTTITQALAYLLDFWFVAVASIILLLCHNKNTAIGRREPLQLSHVTHCSQNYETDAQIDRRKHLCVSLKRPRLPSSYRRGTAALALTSPICGEPARVQEKKRQAFYRTLNRRSQHLPRIAVLRFKKLSPKLSIRKTGNATCDSVIAKPRKDTKASKTSYHA